jgi:hypothetical protein
MRGAVMPPAFPLRFSEFAAAAIFAADRSLRCRFRAKMRSEAFDAAPLAASIEFLHFFDISSPTFA